MTAPAIPVRLNDDFHRRGRLTAALADIAAVTGRNLIAYRRVPLLVVFSTVQPVVFVLLFRYVFGGAIRDVPGGSYVDYLMPGIFAQTVVFGAIGTAVGLATDLTSASSSASGRCPWPGRRCWRGARPPT
jgi:hypothetical protein